MGDEHHSGFKSIIPDSVSQQLQAELCTRLLAWANNLVQSEFFINQINNRKRPLGAIGRHKEPFISSLTIAQYKGEWSPIVQAPVEGGMIPHKLGLCR